MKKIAIVTGGSNGIGLSTIKRLNRDGIVAVSWDLHPPKDDTPYVHCDVSSEENIRSAYAETVKRFGEIDILINNCGIQHMAAVEDFPLEKWNQLIAVMLTGTFLCSKAVIPGLKKKGWGRIVNISSIHGKVASPYKSAYVAAKHGVLGLSKVMSIELADHGVTVNSICPGFVDTQLMRQQITKQAQMNEISEDQVISEIMLKPAYIKKFTNPDQVADMVAFFVSDSASTITGEAFTMSGGWGMGH